MAHRLVSALGTLRDFAVAFAGHRRSTTRMRHQTLVLLRWLAIVGQTAAILFVHLGLGHPVPLVWCAVPVLASTWLNIYLSFRYPPVKRLSDSEAAWYMGFDIIQLTSLLALTGGLLNPFAVLLLAPVSIAASTLSLRSALLLALLAMVGVTAMGLFNFHFPLPWDAGDFDLPAPYKVGIWVSLILAIAFSGISAWRIAAEANRMSDALAATEMVLAREQRLSAVGGLAAAAAHELGTPLATISLVTKELQREVGESGPLADDVGLLRAQAERCREILNRLTLEAQSDASGPRAVPLRDLLEEVAEPHRALGVEIRVRIEYANGTNQDDQSATAFEVWRRPEIVHGLGNIVENAADFAEVQVDIQAEISPDALSLKILDDGPGFSKEVLDKLGEPFTSTRSRIGDDGPMDPEDADVDANHGMGLGFFIAKTLLERSGARVLAGNRPGTTDEDGGTMRPAGAAISVVWPRSKLDAARENQSTT